MAGMTHFLRAGTVVLAGAVAAGCIVSVDSQGQIVRDEKRFTVTGTPEIHLKTFDGAIEIQAWDKADVLVEIEKRGATRELVDQVTVEWTQNGNRIELEVKQPRTESFRGFGFNVGTSAKLIVSVPRRVDVLARTGDGAIHVEHLNGRLELRTGDGAIRAEDVAGELVLHTGDGSVTVDRAEGRLTIDTGDGGVNVSGKLTAVNVHTGDGSIVYRVESGVVMNDDWDITTGDGSVALYLPTSFGAELDAHTGDGSIRNELAIATTNPTNSERRSVKGRLGDGGRLLRVRTGDGSISLKAH
jgi:Putative adhesin